jgi:hypothetical protein
MAEYRCTNCGYVTVADEAQLSVRSASTKTRLRRLRTDTSSRGGWDS